MPVPMPFTVPLFTGEGFMFETGFGTSLLNKTSTTMYVLESNLLHLRELQELQVEKQQKRPEFGGEATRPNPINHIAHSEAQQPLAYIQM